MTRRSFAIVLVFLILGVAAIPPTAQERDRASGTRIALHRGLPAIDRGLVFERLAFSGNSQARVARWDDGLPYEPGRVIVKYRPGSTPVALAAVAGTAGARSTASPTYADFSVLAIDPAADAEAVAAALSARPEVEYAQAAYRNVVHFKPNDPLYVAQWNFPAIDMERAWDINPGAASSVIVAVLDTGVAFEDVVLRYVTRPVQVLTPDGTTLTIDHGTIDVPFAAAPELGGRDRFVAPYDFAWDDVHPVDTLGHGTHVAGTIGQLTNNGVGVAGMAFNVRMMPVKVAAAGPWDRVFGAPGDFTDDRVARAIRYAVDHGAHVLNMSLGRGGPPAPVVEDALRYAVSRGAFCVISAGNGGLQGSPTERIAEIASRVDGVVAVGAVGRTLDRAAYSSVGSWVELAAPGGDTLQGGPGGGILQQTIDLSLAANLFDRPRFDGVVYAFAEGTSMAAPHVSGFAALLIHQGITNPAAIEAAMKRFATDRGRAGRDDEYGFGVINPRATLRGLGLAR